jgi:hypothetical protein
MNSKKMAKKTKLVGPITYSCLFGFKMAQKNPKKSKTMIWTEFLKSTKTVQKSPLNPTTCPTSTRQTRSTDPTDPNLSTDS